MAKYKCPTLGDCDKANSNEIFELAAGEDLKCPQCSTLMEPQVALVPTGGRSGGPKILAGLVVVAAASVGGFLFWQSQNKPRQIVLTEPAAAAAQPTATTPAANASGSQANIGIAPSDAETKSLRVQSDVSLIAGNSSDAELASSKAASNELLKVAIAKMAQGKLDEAERDLTEAQLRSPKQPLIPYNMAILRLKQDRTEDALKEFETSFKSGFTHYDKMDQDTDLNNLRKNPRFAALITQYRTAAK